jgi:type IV pilus assembly protein PilN
MARINLLPWRDKLRAQRKREFGFMVIGGAIITAGLIGYWHLHNVALIEHQEKRNRFLQQQIDEVSAKIVEIERLERTRNQLISRMNIIQNLQSSRPEVVHLFDEMAKTLPEGVHLVEVGQSGRNVVVKGRAQSNARVSAYMRNIEASPWLADPTLELIEQKDDDPQALNSFRLKTAQSSPKQAREKAR